jgi:2-polyprenyl-3-methyl-5-hydroxy-6-metoxy-1,4-benzoquinol methylase
VSLPVAQESRATCCLCGKPGKRPRAPFGARWDGRQFDFLECQGCGSKFVSPQPSADDLRRIYTQESYHDTHYAEVDDVPARSLEILERFVKPGGSLLDFGCGNGRFLRAARRAGLQAEGVELDATTRRRAAEKSGCNVRSLDEIAAGARTYDVIHLGDVLEHLPDPRKVMAELQDALAPGGVFLIEGPLEENRSLVAWSAALTRRVKTALGRSCYAAGPPTHLTRTSAASQRRFFERGLGHDVLHFEVAEDGWPYLAAIDAPSGRNRLRSAIGRTSVLVARLGNPAGLQLGNRFIAVTWPRTN